MLIIFHQNTMGLKLAKTKLWTRKHVETVIFLEHRWLHFTKGPIEKKYKENEIGKSKVIVKGKHLSLCTMSYMVIEAIKASKILKDFGIEIEIIDLRTIRPWDIDSIINSVKKTNRLVILEEAWPYGNISTEITYQIQERAFDHLDAPINSCL